MKRSKFSDGQSLPLFKQGEVGTAVPDLCRGHGINSATFLQSAAPVRGHGRLVVDAD
jgi:putative transposase